MVQVNQSSRITSVLGKHMSSRLPGFYRKTIQERIQNLSALGHFSSAEGSLLESSSLTSEQASVMVENVIGTFALPLAIGANLLCNGKDILVPMVVEEPSVVAAVSNMARLVRQSGGFRTTSDPSVMIGQIQLSPVENVSRCLEILNEHKDELIERSRNLHPRLVERGGGLRRIYFRHVRYDEPDETPVDMVIVHFELDCVDAMGANMINTVAEFMAPWIEHYTGESINLRILSNFATKRLARAFCSLPFSALKSDSRSGKLVAERIVDAYRFAYADPWRASTHNKGIMNGIDPVVIATGNDWRAIEAGAHTWAARTGQYRSLTKWWISGEQLHGRLELPMQVGTVGGSIRNHPQVPLCHKILGNPRAQELAEIITAVGLAQNLGALKALATDGIQQGHMKMHARNIAAQAGATQSEIASVVDILCKEGAFSTHSATEALRQIRLEQ